MHNQGDPSVITSDESLVSRARVGDRSAFGELWQRHATAGLRVARQFTSSIDADDLVSEAYARIYQRVLAGGGPEGAFRPYLYTTIRNLASRWGQTRRDVNVDDIGEFEDPEACDDPVTVALDRTFTVRAFRALPDRWQSVLWYTEVEGMDPHEVAPLLGISANSVAALSYRAREGLRKAWLQAHVSSAIRSSECQWSIARLGDYARRGLTDRERIRVSDHLATCTKCLIISEEVDEVGSRLALVMLPLLLGGIAGGTLLASLAAPSSALVAGAGISAAIPSAFGGIATGGTVLAPVIGVPVVATGLSLAALTAPAIATLTVVLAVSGGVAFAVTGTHLETPTPASRSISETVDPADHSRPAVTGVPSSGSPVSDVLPATGTGSAGEVATKTVIAKTAVVGQPGSTGPASGVSLGTLLPTPVSASDPLVFGFLSGTLIPLDGLRVPSGLLSTSSGSAASAVPVLMVPVLTAPAILAPSLGAPIAVVTRVPSVGISLPGFALPKAKDGARLPGPRHPLKGGSAIH